MPELGVGLLTNQEPDVYEALARRLDEAGADVLSVYNDLRYQPAIGPLLLAARVTERLRLGPAALNPFTVHPYEIAGQIATLDLVSRGRAYLGLAKGAWLDQVGVEEAEPLRGLREAVEVVEKLLSGDETGVAGTRFRLAPGTTLAYRRERARVPLMVGSWGRRTVEWAGTVADEVKVGGTANPDLVPLVREWLGAGSRTRIVVGCVSVVDDDAGWARERVRAAVAPYLEVVARRDPTLGLRPGQEPPLDRFAIAGTPDEVAARVRSLWEAGADRVELGTPQGRTTPVGVDVICDRVLPLLRDG
jgi:5,10-methylenetetrahydromethanopterin reductase